MQQAQAPWLQAGELTCAGTDSQGFLSNGKGLSTGEPDSSLDAPVQGGVAGRGEGGRLRICCPVLLMQGCRGGPVEVV